MRSYVTILDGELGLLPFHVRYYRRLGADEFAILIYGTEADLSTATSLVLSEGGQPRPLAVLPREQFTAAARERFIRQHHPAGEYAFFCDLDEFAEVTPQQIAECVAQKQPFIHGDIVDRIAAGGKLLDPPLPRDPQSSSPNYLEDTYSHYSRVARKFGTPHNHIFVFSQEAPLRHDGYCEYSKQHRRSCLQIRIHHFKWQANVVSRLRKRLELIARVGKQRSSWYRRNQRILDHLQAHGGIEARYCRPAGRVLGI